MPVPKISSTNMLAPATSARKDTLSVKRMAHAYYAALVAISTPLLRGAIAMKRRRISGIITPASCVLTPSISISKHSYATVAPTIRATTSTPCSAKAALLIFPSSIKADATPVQGKSFGILQLFTVKIASREESTTNKRETANAAMPPLSKSLPRSA